MRREKDKWCQMDIRLGQGPEKGLYGQIKRRVKT